MKILVVFTACVEFMSGWQHARNYISIHRPIGRTGLGWIDGQKSPVFRRGKFGNPTHYSLIGIVKISDLRNKSNCYVITIIVPGKIVVNLSVFLLFPILCGPV